MSKSVLLIGNFLSNSNGIHVPGETLAKLLVQCGWSVHTASHKPGRVSRLLDMLRTVWRLSAHYSAAYVEVFSGPAFGWAEAVCWALRQVGKPYVCALHGGNLPEFSRRWPTRVRHLLQSAAAVTTPSVYLQTMLKHVATNLHLIPNPLELEDYLFRLRSRPQPRLVWMRAFHDIYNPCLASQALALLTPEFPGLDLAMVGPDKGDGSLLKTRKLAQELGIADRISFPGQIPKSQVPTWLDRGDIFLNTSNIDNTPVSVLEAMASGLCVVSTEVGGIPYLLRNEIDAVLVPPDDPVAMAAGIRRILTEADLARRLSHNARLTAQQFDQSLVLPQWDKLLTEVASGQGQ